MPFCCCSCWLEAETNEWKWVKPILHFQNRTVWVLCIHQTCSKTNKTDCILYLHNFVDCIYTQPHEVCRRSRPKYIHMLLCRTLQTCWKKTRTESKKSLLLSFASWIIRKRLGKYIYIYFQVQVVLGNMCYLFFGKSQKNLYLYIYIYLSLWTWKFVIVDTVKSYKVDHIRYFLCLDWIQYDKFSTPQWQIYIYIDIQVILMTFQKNV